MRGAFRHQGFSRGEEIAHAITHGLGTLLSIACLVVLVVLAAQKDSASLVVGVTIFGATLVILYAASTFYHALTPPRAKYVFERPVEFVVGGLEVPSKGFAATLECTVRFVSQTVRPDTTLGHFDFQTQRVVVPPKQGYMLGWFDNLAWRETEKQWEDFESLGAGRFALGLTLFEPVPRDDE